MPVSEFPADTFGSVRIRHVTNPQSRCFRWTPPEPFLMEYQDSFQNPPPLGDIPQATLPAAVPTCAPNVEPSDATGPPGLSDNRGLDVVYSDQGNSRSRIRGSARGRSLLFTDLQLDIIRAWSKYFAAQGATEGVIMQIMGVDSTNANGGLKMRFWFTPELAAVCDTIASALNVYGALTDAAAEEAKAWLRVNVFDPYSTTAFGYVQWRPSMMECSAFSTPMPTAEADTGTFEGSVIFLSVPKPVIGEVQTGGTQVTLRWPEASHYSPITYTVKCVTSSVSASCADAPLGTAGAVTVSGGEATGVVTGLAVLQEVACFAIATDEEGQQSCSEPSTVTPTGVALDLDGANIGCSLGGCTTWTDTSGNGLNAVLEGTGITKVSQYGGVLSCNGVNNLARGANAPEPLLDITSEYSLEVWFAPDSSSTAWKRIFGRKTMEGIWTGDDAGRPVIRFQRVAASGGVPFPAASFYPSSNGADYPLVKTKWYHVVGTSSGSSAAGWTHKIYVDGVLGGTSTSPAGTTFAASTQAYTICEGYDNGGRQFWAGDVGIARFYPRAIAASEVLSNYRASLDRFTDYTLSATSLTTAGDVTSWPNTGKRSGFPASATGKQDGTAAGLPQFDAAGTFVSLNNNRAPSTNIGNFIEMGSMPLNIPTNDGLTVYTYVRFTPSAPLTSYYWPRLFEFAAQTTGSRDMVGIEVLALTRRRSHSRRALRSFSRSSSASDRTQGGLSATCRA